MKGIAANLYYVVVFAVCVKVLNRFMDETPKDLRGKSQTDIEDALRKFCKGLKKNYKEDKFVSLYLIENFLTLLV